MNFAICDDEPFMVQEISNQISQYMNARKRSEAGSLTPHEREESLTWIILSQVSIFFA